MSIPHTVLIYRGIIGINYLQFIHMMTVFILLGIGADDNFVIIDAWKQSLTEVPRSADLDEWALRRLIFAYTRAMEAIFNTSFTTALAFMAMISSKILPIQTFGLFAAIAVIINYLMVISLIPAALIFYNTHFPSKAPALQQIATSEEGAKSETKEAGAADDAHAVLAKQPRLDRFFTEYFTPFILKRGHGGIKWNALAAVVLSTAIGVFLTTQAFNLTPPIEAEEYLPKGHMFHGFFTRQQTGYLSSTSSAVEIKYATGIASVDTSKFDPFNPDDNRGDAVWDSSFDLYDSSTRDALLAFCEAVRTEPCNLEGCSLGLLHLPDSTTCFLEEFEAWGASTFGSAYTTNGTGAMVSEEVFYERLTLFRESTYPGYVYGDEPDGNGWDELIGFVDGELQFVIVQADLTMQRRQPGHIKKPVINAVGKLCDRSSLRFWHTAGLEWAWYVSTVELVNGLFNGFAICFPVSFVMLLFATGNVFLALHAIIAIMMIVGSVLGSASLFLGWSLGVTESIAGVMVIGFAVDYTIHLGHMYNAASHEQGVMDRDGRVAYSLRLMGATVVGGAATTAGAGAFMLACQFSFFLKIGFLVFMTIGYSFVYSFLFFIGGAAVFGPERHQGDVFHSLKEHLSKNKT
jgi:hypothetical protein